MFRKRTRLLSMFSLPLLAWALAACGDTPAQPVPGDGGVEPAPEPTWDDAEVQRRWGFDGIGEGFTLLPVPDGAGGQHLVVGGRRLARFAPEGLAAGEPDWTLTWPEDPTNLLGPENRYPRTLANFDADGDGRDEILVVENKNGYVVDADTGAVERALRLDTRVMPYSMALLERETGAPHIVVAGGTVAAYSGDTGERLWDVKFAHGATFVTAGRLDASGPAVVVGIEVAGVVTNELGVAETVGEPAVFGFTATGEPIFEFAPIGAVFSVETADLDGSGLDEVLVGTDQGLVQAVGADGVELWTSFVGIGMIRQLLVEDLDGDGRPEILARRVTGWDEAAYSEVIALDADGNELWRRHAGLYSARLQLHPVGDGSHVLLATADETRGTIGGGAVIAMDPVDGTELWRSWPAITSTLMRWDGEDVLALGGYDTRIRMVDPRTGAPADEGAGGGYVYAVHAADLDGDGAAEILSGDSGGRFAARDAEGRLLWEGFVPEAELHDVAAAEVGPGEWRVAAVGIGGEGNNRGALMVRDGAGELVQLRVSYYLFDQVELADVTGDGVPEILVGATAGLDSRCAVLAFDLDGEPLAEVILPNCTFLYLTVGASAPGVPAEIGVVGLPLYAASWAALIDSDFKVRWSKAAGVSHAAWGTLVDGDFVVLGGDPKTGAASAVKLGASDGTELWHYTAPARPDPFKEGSNVSTVFHWGALVPGGGSDGTLAVAGSTDDNAVHLLDAETGQPMWVTPLQADDTPDREKRLGGPITFVPGSSSAPPWIAVGETASLRSRARVRALGLDGEVLATFQNEGEAQAAAPVRTAPDRNGVVFGSGLGVHVYEAVPVEQ